MTCTVAVPSLVVEPLPVASNSVGAVIDGAAGTFDVAASSVIGFSANPPFKSLFYACAKSRWHALLQSMYR